MSNRRRAQHRDAHGPIRSQGEIIIAIMTGVAVVVVTVAVIWGIWIASKPDPVATPTLPPPSTSVPSTTTAPADGSTGSTSASSSTTAPSTSSTAPASSTTSSTTEP